VSVLKIVSGLAAAALIGLLPGCGTKPAASGNPPSPTPQVSASALFEDVAARSGVSFVHVKGGTGKFYFIESTPAGCAFLDYDNDGFLDILLLQSGSSEPPDKVKDRPHCALYHNNGDGTFTDVTAGSGLDKDLGYAQGVAVGDYDNDGYPDLFLTSYGGNHLLHNTGVRGQRSEVSKNRSPPPSTLHPTPLFEEVTAQMGLGRVHSTGYATSAAFGDYDNDGRLDLYVCYYCPWTWALNKACRDPMQRLDYCTPEIYDPDVHVLYHNDGDHFTDVSAKAGITKGKGRGLAVAFVDYDGDGRQDIYVANDLSAAMLWHNNGNGTFTDVAMRAGCAYSEGGAKMAGMGIAIADYDHSGQESLYVSNFSGLPNTLFRNLGNGLFEDVSMASGVALPHMKFLTFGCEFFDYDADGWPDLITANGHVQLHADTQFEGVTFKERKQLFHNAGNGTFKEVTDPALLGDLGVPMVARGLAVGDFDNDGRLDVLVNNQDGPAQLFRNRDRSPNHWVEFLTVGVRSNREGRHARFVLTAGGARQTATVRAGSSYCSSSDRRVYFGLGSADKITRVEVRWPSGQRDVLKDVAADAIYLVTEGRGITGRLPTAKR
jgi:hypothetical protein